MSFDSQYATSH